MLGAQSSLLCAVITIFVGQKALQGKQKKQGAAGAGGGREGGRAHLDPLSPVVLSASKGPSWPPYTCSGGRQWEAGQLLLILGAQASGHQGGVRVQVLGLSRGAREQQDGSKSPGSQKSSGSWDCPKSEEAKTRLTESTPTTDQLVLVTILGNRAN